ncbi:hypothetical protein V474_07725 [Novosphingobium barchaimii LL02]|uniref:Uncharacterized protein n=1 Tax=Novosphingobium barchaimii LL02 TaxID=1114963 RepID=A0A0J7Y9H7_9SPHN|nr:hypothetical protein [Novosphingobium barchaimii]KMS59978.1 hypothetical protein V474_07725 [Novosphingobium barchaimii LL02]
MDDDEVPVSERVVTALLTQMIRSNMIPINDVMAAAEILKRMATRLPPASCAQ